MNNWKFRLNNLSRDPLLTPVLLALAALGIGLLSLWFAVMDNHTAMFLSYLINPYIILLNLLPPLFLALFLYFLIGRAWISFGITAVAIVGLSVVNYYKLTFRNDPVMFEDLLLFKEAGNMAGKYKLFINRSIVAAIFLILLGGIFLFFAARSKTGWRPRLICSLLLLMVAIPLHTIYTDLDLYINKTSNNNLINSWSATQAYTSKGFLYPFLYSMQEAIDAPPGSYDADRTETILSSYTDTDIPEDQKVDIMGIQLEAYNDFTKFGVLELSPSVYEEFHKLEAEGYSGNLVTNIFAGGTVDTERCFLTGYSRLGSFRSPTNSYVRYFKDQGYTTEGSHPCYAWFYNRSNINENLGFDGYFFLENHYGALNDNKISGDNILFPEIIRFHEEHKASSDAPYFSFNVTYQGHGPYDTTYAWLGDDYVVDNGQYTQEALNLMNNYFGSIQDTNNALKDFFDHYRASSDPVVIVMYGDHNPWMGDNNSIYDMLGINLDLSTQEGFMNYYATRYLIWANDAAKNVLGNDFQGIGPDIGPYFLMDQVFRLCGWEGSAYMQAQDSLMDRVGVMSQATYFYLEHGDLTDTLAPDNLELVRQFNGIQYYYRKHFTG